MSVHARIDGLVSLFVVGPSALVWGLNKLRVKRLLENTPTSKVRSAAMGMVELNGMAKPRKLQKSPVSGRDACWWACQIQEYRKRGKHSSWVTIKTVQSVDLFFLEDSTGRVLVNPQGAELHVSTQTYDLNSGTRTQLAPVLNGWGIDDMTWFGFNKRLRILEQVIMDCSPLFVLGHLVSIGNHLDDRRARLMERLRKAKANPSLMTQADTNEDGVVDADEWDAFRMKQEEEFLKEELARQAQAPQAEALLIQAPQEGQFIVSTKSESELLGSYAWLAPLAVAGGIALSGLATWLAINQGWNVFMVLGSLAVGFVLTLCFKLFSLKSYFGGLPS